MDQSQILQNNESTVKGQQAYKKIKVLGQGSMGKAYLVQSTSDNKLYVMKRINIGHLSPEQKQNAMRQAQLHSIVSHPNIIAFKEIYHTTKDKLCIIMQYAESNQYSNVDGDLDQLIQEQKDIGKFLTEDTVLSYFTQICLGLRQIHSKKIIHRDIKGANVFLTQNKTVKIGDFGISKVIDQTVQASKSFVGTPYYLSPQMVQGKPYSTKADIWALGVLLYNLCSQRLPFEANSLPLLALKILKGSFPPLTGPYSKDLKALILSMLQVDAKKRPSCIDILTKPLLTKYVPKQQAQKIQALKQKPRIPKNSTVANLASTNIIGHSINTVKPSKKSTNQKKISDEQKKQKQYELKQEKKKKRIQQFKSMREDIRQKRTQLQKQKMGNTEMLKSPQSTEQSSNKAINSKKGISQQKSPIKPKVDQEQKKQIEKPWKTVKNRGNSKKEVQFQILVPPIKPKQVKKQEDAPPIDFKIQIKQFGKRPASSTQILDTPDNHDKQDEQFSKQMKTAEIQNQDISYQDQIEEDEHEESEQLDFKNMMNHLNNAQAAVKGLNIKTGRQIQLYQQSENFDQNQKEDLNSNKKPQTPQMPDMNTMQEHSWNFIHNSDNLEQCRQILEEGLGQERFMKAYQILSQHLQFSQEKKIRGEQLDDYTFNREVLRKKLDFLTDKQFHDYLVLMYTLIVIEIEEMKKNLDD